MVLVELVDVTKDYGTSSSVLKEVNLGIDKSEFLVIRGRSGAGKSTLLRILGLLDRPTSGRVVVNNTDSSNMKDSELSELRLRNFGFVFQRFNLIPALTNIENVELPMELAGISTRERRDHSQALLRSFGLLDKGKRFPGEISIGEQQRVAIARALANNPRVLLADEPISSVDEESAEAVLGLFREINTQRGVSVVITTTSFSEKYRSSRELALREGSLEPLDNV